MIQSHIINNNHLTQSITSPQRNNGTLHQSLQRNTKNNYLNSLKIFPSSNPIKQPNPDGVLKAEKIPLTHNPGGFLLLNFFFSKEKAI